MCASGEETFDGFRLEVIESKTTRAARASCSVIFQLTIPFNTQLTTCMMMLSIFLQI